MGHNHVGWAIFWSSRRCGQGRWRPPASMPDNSDRRLPKRGPRGCWITASKRRPTPTLPA